MEEKVKVRPMLENMEIGQTLAFDIAKMKSIRTQCSEIGVILNRQYTTRIDRADRKIYVERKN